MSSSSNRYTCLDSPTTSPVSSPVSIAPKKGISFLAALSSDTQFVSEKKNKKGALTYTVHTSYASTKKTTPKNKTKMCRDGEKCERKETCWFAHDKSELVKGTNSKLRTKMCNSVGSGKPCPRGNKCWFAHNDAELVKPTIPVCNFGFHCNRIKCTNGYFSNVGDNVCRRLHQHESEDNYRARVEQAPQPAPKAPLTQPMVQPIECLKPAFSKVAAKKPENQGMDKTVLCLRVQKELAFQAFTNALEGGKRNIQVIIV